ncbi:hypothetical protein TNCV_117531 [Trichonephila clavipes]|nr:hypothetical protein TNCV_117531 [Trichonephila clavipes]
MIVQFRNEKVSNQGSIPITIDCNVVAFIVFEEGFHQPIKRTKQSVFLDVAVIRDISCSCLDPNDFTVLNCIVKGHASLSSPSMPLRLCSRFTLLATWTYFDPKDFSPHPIDSIKSHASLSPLSQQKGYKK